MPSPPNPHPVPTDFDALQAIASGTAQSTGDDFFRTLVQHLAMAMATPHAFVSEFVPPQRIRTLAFWSGGKIVDNIEYDLPGTPCELVIGGSVCHLPTGVQDKYPVEAGIESYLGVPLVGPDGTVFGHLCVLDEVAMPANPGKLAIFRIFAARATAELARLKSDSLRRESEERFRDLFDEAPIAYVHEGLDSRFIRANKAALQMLGVTAEEARDFLGTSLVADTPDAQRRVKEAFESIGRGTDTSGLVLELRRKDNGKPVWVQWWSRPDPSGTFTRSMLVDITERILMEQEQARLKAQNTYLQEEIKSVHNFDEIVGASRGLLKVLESVQRVASTDATVLILGESGTGKELVARALHSTSKRADKPFIKINCAALPAGLVESELFGHERGAFSGALQRRLGRFELANGGTIFLDEIGEVPLDVQVKLLRVLQEREFERVGGNQTIFTDVRVIAATNRDLQKALADGSFRADLYYRLNVFPVEMPALRERREDIPLLVQFFVQKYASRVGRRIDSVDHDTMERLARYHWPGNIRELENVVERALILASSPVLSIEPEALPARREAGAAENPVAEPLPTDSLNAVQREHILEMLQKTRWVLEGERGAASLLGMKPATLRHRMKKLGIARPTDFRG